MAAVYVYVIVNSIQIKVQRMAKDDLGLLMLVKVHLQLQQLLPWQQQFPPPYPLVHLLLQNQVWHQVQASENLRQQYQID